MYETALKYCCNDELKNDIEQMIKYLSNEEEINPAEKIVIFVKNGMDTFLRDIIKGLEEIYIVKKIIVNRYEQIDIGMEWSDICWFEWCDELIIYGSKHSLAKDKKIICRLHRYEAFSNYIYEVEWNNVDKVIFVSDHIKERVLKYVKIEEDKIEKVYNGVNSDNFTFKRREKGFNIACIGYLNLRKNPMMIIQMFNEIVKQDERYKLFFAGNFQDDMLKDYILEIIIQLGLEKNIVFDGYINNEDMQEWLSDKNYIVTGSIAEGHPVGVMEAMMCGIKPCIHYFPGIEKMYPKEYIWKSYEEGINIIIEEKYDSNEYRDFIERNYSLTNQINKINYIIENLRKKENKEIIMGLNSDDIIDYISENKFSSGYKLYLSNNNNNLIDRMNLITEKCSGKKIVHLGCTDHIQLISDKREKGLWLHDKITSKAKECIGFDINSNAVKYVNDELNINNVFFDDIVSRKNEMICSKKWDMIIVGEILEHVNNPVDFLNKIKKMYSGVIEKILITVPNALKLENYIFAEQGYECINSDHRYWFTPYTISKVLYESQIEIEELYMTPGYEILDNKMKEILKNNNLLMDTIVIIGKL